MDLVEQDAQRSAESLTGSSKEPDMHIPSHTIATGAEARSACTEQEEEEVAIPEWVITESREMNQEVTPPAQLFFRDQGNGKMATVGRRH